MDVSLTPEIEEQIRRKVESGLYPSPTEVVHEALRLLDEGEQWPLDELRQAIAIGIEQADRGQVAPLDMDVIQAKVQARLAKRRAPGLMPQILLPTRPKTIWSTSWPISPSIA